MVKPENFREMGAVIAKTFNWVAVIVSVTMVLALAVAGSANAQGSSPTPASPQTPAAQAPAQNSPAPAGKTPAPAAAAPNRVGVREAPATNITVDGSEAMFTTMCALLAAGFESQVSSDGWTPFRTQIGRAHV